MALEVGCGAGWMLRALRRHGWMVVGNERTFEGTIFASRMNGVPMFTGDLSALKAHPQFDLIILFQVLEHLQDPLGTLRHCATSLKPRGSLVVAVPNLESWQARLTGRSWFHLDVPRHLFHFSPRSLSEVLSKIGLQVNSLRFVSFEHDPYGWEQSILNLLGFKPNLLTKALMGIDRQAILSPGGLVMVLVGGLLLIPSFLIAMSSWLAGAGASFEVLAVKPMSDGPAQSRS